MTQGLSIMAKSSSGIRRGILSRKYTILSNLVITNNSQSFDWFIRPPVRAVYKIHIFNYTNVEDYETGKAKKLKVEDTGPYIYRETLTRVNQVFHPNGSVSFQEKRSFQWEGGSPDDEIIVVPNVPLLAALSIMKDRSYFIRRGFSIFLSAHGIKAFVSVPARGFLWGYEDNIFTLSQSTFSQAIVPLQEKIPFDKFGVLAHKNGISGDTITINTGADDMSKFGMIQLINGKNKSKQFWNDDKCDRIHGTQGFMFPPGTFDHPNATIDVYSLDMCRTLSLRSHGSGTSFGIPSLTFKPPTDIFTLSPSSENYCYCPESSSGSEVTRQCPPAGLVNSSACSFNLPFLASFPHFYTGDKILREKIDGLNPQAELHESSVELHPRLGVLIGGHSRMQMNIQAQEAPSIPHLHPIEDGQILPLIWLDVGIDNIPESMLTIFKHAYFTAAAAEMSIQYGSIVGIFLPLCTLFYIIRKQRIERRAALKRNASEMSQIKLLDAIKIANI
ncbi:hypothetical protein PV328_000837 [Microctonus aethiopoides]|uniref:Scavenger receptor class B member 1 n=1 Tax=Microctonus aethiopoides TaxID=144406 RepID=A0AA39KWY4_9HYME|nr:hypothetical protein PV328_000837 [Microctonus aethiopoides]